MKNFEVWSEGYAATGESSGAIYYGTFKGDSFREACIACMKEVDPLNYYFSIKDLTYWGCRLFDNESKARMSFS